MKVFINKYLLASFLGLTCVFLKAQGIDGPAVVATGSTHTYSTQLPPLNGVWSVTGGNINSQSIDYANITWSSSGTVKLKSGKNVLATLSVTVGTPPSAPSVSFSSRCGTGTVTISASGAPSGGNYKWYSSSSGGSALHTGSSYTTPSLSSTTSYWVSAVSSIGLESNSRTQAQVIINTIPTQPLVNGGSRCGTGSVTLSVLNTDPQYDYYWYTSSSGGSSVHIGTSYTTPSISSTTTYYVSRKDQCESSRRSVTATVYSSFNAGSVSGSQTICYNANPSVLTNSSSASGGPGGYSYQWESRNPGGSWSAISGATSTTYDPPSLTSTKEYRRKATVSVCGTLYSNTVTITVRSDLTPGSINGGSTICYNEDPSSLGNASSPSGGAGSYSYQWESRTPGGSWSNVSGATSSTYNPGAMTATKEFRRKVTDSSCGTEYSNTQTITVRSNTSAGSISGSQTICYNSNAALLSSSSSASGGSGSNSYQWQSRSPGGSWANISGATSITYDPPNLTSTKEYRRGFFDLECGNTYTSAVIVTVRADLTSGSINGAQTVCHNGDPGTLGNSSSPSGGAGSYSYQWEIRNPGGSWSNVSGATSSTYNPPTLTTTKEYRRKVTDSSCGSEYSNTQTVTVRANLSAGSINGAQTVCYNGNPSALGNSSSPSGGAGGYSYQWESRSPGGSWSNVSGATSTTYDPPSLTSSKEYRRKATDSSCGSKYSNTQTVTVRADLSAGSINGSQTICYNDDPSTLGNASSPSGGAGGYSYQWEIRNPGGSWSNVSGATGSTYNPSNLTTTKEYRRKVTDSSCGTKYSNTQTVTVRANLSSGSINGAQTICYNADPSSLGNASSPSGGAGGYSYQWEIRNPGGSWSNISGATSSTYNPSNLTTTKEYRRKVTDSSCGTLYSNTQTITVRSNLQAGSINGVQTICYNDDPSTLGNASSPSGGAGSYSYQWEIRNPGGSWSNVSGATSSTYNPPTLTTTKEYRRKVTDSSCGTLYSNTQTVTVRADLSAGSINGGQSICYSSSPSTLGSASSPGGGSGSYSYIWQSKVGTEWLTISGATSATYSPSTLNSTTEYRRGVVDPSCGTKYSSSVTVSVYDEFEEGSIGGTQTICHSSSPSSISSSSAPSGGQGGYTYQWQSRPSGGSWSDISGATNSSYSPGSLTATTEYRRKDIDANCGALETNVIVVTVNNALSAGSISGAQTICYGATPSSFGSTAASGGSGSITYQWKHRDPSGTWYDISGATSETYSAGTLTGDKEYKRVATDASCGSVETSAVLVTVRDDLTAGSISGIQTICYDEDASAISNSTLPTGGVGFYSYQWQEKPSGGSWTDIGGATNSSFDPSNLTVDTEYRRVVTDSGCGTATTSAIAVSVLDETATPSNPASTNICGETTLEVNAAPTDVTWYWQSTSTGTSTTNSGTSFDRSSGTTYFVRGKDDNTDCWGPALQVNYTVDAIPAQPSTVSVEKRFGKSVLMRGTPAPELDETWYWQGTDPNGTSTTNSNVYDTVTVAGTYYLRGQTLAGCWGDARAVTVTVEAEPATSQSGSSEIAIGTSSELSLTTSYDTYSWKKDGIEVSTDATYEVRASGSYTVTVTKTGVSDSFTSDPVVFTGFGGFGSENHIISSTITQSGVTDNDEVIDLSASSRRINVAYYDGLGRPIQQVAVAQSPLGRDIIQIADYDDLGREPVRYLPYVSSEQGSGFHTNAIAEQLAFYSATGDDIVNDDDPYSVTIIEESPLGRVLKQGAPGSAWQPTADPEDSTDHVVRFAYHHNSTEDSVKLWEISSGMPAYVDIYDAGTLMKDVTMDENNSRLDVYKDKMGRVISRRVYDSDSTWVETQYLYDDFGQLRFVLQPNLSAELDEDDSPTQAQIDTLAFQYNYDRRHRMVEKRVPGAGWVYTVYDIWDRPVLTQDSEQRENDQWLFSAYDALNRPAMTGILEDDSPRDSLQLHLDSLANRFITRIDTVYSATAYPFTDIGGGALLDTLTFSFYDTYDGLPDSLAYEIPDDFNSIYSVVDSTHAIGKLVATKINILGSDKFLWTTMFYNFRGESVQTVAENHLGGRDRITTETDFIGQVLKTRREHTTENDTVSIDEWFEYDDAGRMLKHWHHITDTVLLADNSYNELGELIEKNIGDELQSIDYQYNIRGWMTKMNNGSTLDEAGDMFGMELQYDAAGEYNGNIGKMIWKSPYGAGSAGEEQTFDYSYDKLNRLIEADYNLGKDTEGYFSVTGISYDLNGNILNLERWRDSTLVDHLQYSYKGNQLAQVNDAADKTVGFKDGYVSNGSVDDYLYDGNGNLFADKNKGIDTVLYSYMNMPLKVLFQNGDSLVYTYNAGGVKLRKTFYDKSDTLVLTTDYLGGMIYEGEGLDSTRLQIIPHAEGRVLLKELTTGKAYDHQYHLKDHLGNTRVTVRSQDENYTIIETFETGEETGYFEDLHQYVSDSANTTVGGNEVERLTSGTTGAMAFLKVGKQDTVRLSVMANYAGIVSGNTLATTAYSALFNAFDAGFGSGTETNASATSGVFDEALSGAGMSGKGDASSAPRAYLNYILFDSKMNYLSAGYTQVTTAAHGVSAHELVSLDDIIISEPGYLLTYLSNENQETVDVFFDDFAIYHGMSNVAQIDDYYPFGLSFNSYHGGIENKCRYNGKEQQKETGWYDYLARQYDPSIGRFTSVDPTGDMHPSWSPFRYAFDNPIRFIDPNGSFEMDAKTQRDYPMLTEYLKNNIQSITRNSSIITYLMHAGDLTYDQIKNDLQWGKGPKIKIDKLRDSDGRLGEYRHADQRSGIKADPNSLYLDVDLVNLLKEAKNQDERDAAIFFIGVEILHEYTHYGDFQKDGKFKKWETGEAFEKWAYGEDIDDLSAAMRVLNNWKGSQDGKGQSAPASISYPFSNDDDEEEEEEDRKKGKRLKKGEFPYNRKDKTKR